jgi:transcriptional regulator with XRE-family HTH domain
MTTWEELREEVFAQDPEARREYERLKPLFAVMTDVVRLRNSQGLTQAQLAERMGRKQPSIGRFEAGNANPTLGFLQDIAEALGARLVVRIEPLEAAAVTREGEPKRQQTAARPRKRRAGAAA